MPDILKKIGKLIVDTTKGIAKGFKDYQEKSLEREQAKYDKDKKKIDIQIKRTKLEIEQLKVDEAKAKVAKRRDKLKQESSNTGTEFAFFPTAQGTTEKPEKQQEDFSEMFKIGEPGNLDSLKLNKPLI